MVWKQVSQLLKNPQLVEQEYKRRLKPAEADLELANKLQLQIARLRQRIARLIDSYAEGYIEMQEFEPRVKQMKERSEKLQQQAKQLADQSARQAELQLIIGRLEEFAEKVRIGLGKLDFADKRDIVRTLVKRIEVQQGQVNV